jgi:hypothetical protein
MFPFFPVSSLTDPYCTANTISGRRVSPPTIHLRALSHFRIQISSRIDCELRTCPLSIALLSIQNTSAAPNRCETDIRCGNRDHGSRGYPSDAVSRVPRCPPCTTGLPAATRVAFIYPPPLFSVSLLLQEQRYGDRGGDSAIIGADGSEEPPVDRPWVRRKGGGQRRRTEAVDVTDSGMDSARHRTCASATEGVVPWRDAATTRRCKWCVLGLGAKSRRRKPA